MNIASARLTSPYGIRQDPFTERTAWHNGVDIGIGADYAARPQMLAPAEGIVLFADSKSGYGRMVDVQLLPSGHVVRFAHLRELLVTKGDKLSAGDVVGIMGSSGRSTGRHLHFEYIVDGKMRDPEGIEGLALFPTE